MTNYLIMTTPPDELYHFGVQGMKWGVRRFQNKDGSLTAAGKRRAAKQEYKETKKDIDMKWAKAADRWEDTTRGGKVKNPKADRDLDAAADKWIADRKLAKQAYKDAIKQIDIERGKTNVPKLVANILNDTTRDTSGQTMRDRIQKENDRFKRPTLEDERRRNSNSNI